MVGGILSLVFYPFIICTIKLDDGGPAFIAQERVGRGDELVRIYKFRSMSGNDNGAYGEKGSTTLTVTRVGKYLRVSRLDELPQFLNVIKGEMSLVGPRLEFPGLVREYERQIPYYGVRHLVKPGLFGWAQLYYHGDPHHMTDVEATKMKLSYDLYYLKHRSLLLDVLIILKTIRRLLIRGNA
jgi:lipopolysaccharide/colanic/teichoic acid biosynthesis glycosyltransferase